MQVGVEDKKLQRLLDGAFRNSPLAKELRNTTKYVDKSPPKLNSDHKTLIKLFPHASLRQISIMLDSMRRLFTGNKTVDEKIRTVFFNAWRADSIEHKMKEKQRLTKTDIFSLRMFQRMNTMEVLELVIGVYAKLYAENLSVTGDMVISYSNKE